jgi:hypothetical protein
MIKPSDRIGRAAHKLLNRRNCSGACFKIADLMAFGAEVFSIAGEADVFSGLTGVALYDDWSRSSSLR